MTAGTRMAPAPPMAVQQLRRSEAELLAAQFSSEASDRFRRAHLAALRAAGAVVELRGGGGQRRRGAPRSVWELLDAVAPELSGWSAYFASGAQLRAAIEAGRSQQIDPERAEQALAAAEDFHDEVAGLLSPRRLAAG